MSQTLSPHITISSAGLERERSRNKRQWLVIGLLLGDLSCVFLSLACGFILKFFTPLGKLGIVTEGFGGWFAYLPQFALAIILLLGLAFYNNSYSRSGLLSSPLLAVKYSLQWGLLLALVSLGLKVDPQISRLFILFSTASLCLALPLWRNFYKHSIVSRTNFRACVQRKILIIGWNKHADNLLQRSLDSDKIYPVQVVGVVGAPDGFALPKGIHHWPAATDISQLLSARHYDEVIIAEGKLDDEAVESVQRICGREMIDFALLPAKVSTFTRCLQLESLQGVPLLTQSKRPLDGIGFSALKRGIDCFGALVGLFIFSPVIAVFCLLVYRESPGPVFYLQERTGRGGKPFKIIKIRSMRTDAEAQSGAKWCTKDDSRRLKVGALMRKLNIDELPQFWNVLKGEMSLVGPRPERPELIQDFKSKIEYYNLRHTAKPGITGWAQVNGWRGDTCLHSRIACDLEYIERAGLWFDMRIILMTLKAVKNAY